MSQEEAVGDAALSLDDLRAPVRADLTVAESRLGALCGGSQGIAAEAFAHVNSAGGKRLRPLVCLLSARTCSRGGPEGQREPLPDAAYSCAAAIEAAHLCSLLHDDVIDEAETRRGRETVRRKWGNRAAVLVGDHLAAVAYRELAADGDRLYALRVLSQAVIAMCESELLHAGLGAATPSEETYRAIIGGKTAQLFAASARLGAWAVGEERYADGLDEYGRCLGMAFQIADDLLDLYGDPERMGKPLGRDVEAGVTTLPLIRALEVDTSGELAALVAQTKDRGLNAERGARLASSVERFGGRAYASELMRQFAEDARAAVAGLPSSAALEALRRLPDFVCKRPA